METIMKLVSNKLISYKRTVFVFLFLITLSSNSFSQANYGLKGSWESFKIELENGDDGSNITLNGQPFDGNDLIIRFINDNLAIYNENNFPQEVSYSIKNDVLQIGALKYLIEKQNSDTLIILEKDNGNPYKIFYTRIYF